MIRTCSLATLLLIAKLAAAEPAPTAPPTPTPPERGYTTPQVEVVGRAPRALDHVPGSATLIKQEDLRHLAPQSGADALRTVPGLNVVGEDPIGLRLNIGIRGLDPNRSRKVLVLEDGVPISMNPYGTPELYYAPPIERMERLEIVKGSGSILFGPQTIGGVINYISRDPPRRLSINADARYGSYNYLLLQAGFGNSHGPIGYRIDALHRRYEGARRLDLGATDVTAKFRLQLASTSILGLKLNFYDEQSSDTYLGLTAPQYAADPQVNHAENDRFRIRRYALSATHSHFFSNGLALRTTLYAHEIGRVWRRQDYDRQDLGRRYERIIPGAPGEAPDNDGGAIFFRPTVGIRDRAYTVAGLEPRLSWNYAVRRLAGELIAGMRLHYEAARERYVAGAFPTAESGEARDDEARRGVALAAYAQNRFTILDRFRVTPGLRLETFFGQRHILRQRQLQMDGQALSRDVDIASDNFSWALIPGLGLSVDVVDPLTLYGGVHRGFAPPRTKDAITPDGRDLNLSPELSWNYELGARLRLKRYLHADVAGFFIDFQNELLPPRESGTAGAEGTDGVDLAATSNAATYHAGIEESVTFDVAELLGQRFSLPLLVNYTYLPLAHFHGGNFDGLRLPYAPEHLLYGQLRFVHPVGVAAQLGLTYVAPQFTDRDNNIAESRDGLTGRIEGYVLLDARLSYTYAPWGVSAYLAGKNLTNQQYVTSRAPAGILPGAPMQLFGGLQYQY